MKLIKYTAILMSVIFLSGCTKRFEDINTNPVLVTEDLIQPSMLFTAVLKGSIYTSYDNSTFKEYSNYYSDGASGAIFRNTDWESPFSEYRGTLINISEVIRLTAEDPALVDANAMARIWKVWIFHQITDAYGDLPYFEALKSMEETINQPKYDTQEAIYLDMLKELKESAAKLGSATEQSAVFSDADILYSGDVDKWRRFANSLRLRLAIRVRYANAAMAQANASELVSSPLIDENSLNAALSTIDGDNSNNRNPLYNAFVNSGGYPVWPGLTVTQELLKRDDPRLPVFADLPPVAEAGYRGRPLTLGEGEKGRYPIDSTATLPFFFREAEHSIIVMNAAEVYFLRAEAALTGLTSEDANEMFRKGIEASLSQYDIAQDDADDYLNSPAASISTGTEEEKLENIIVQKYLAMYQQGTEAWTEYRRTGYPLIWTGSDLGNTEGRIPRRATYPSVEYLLNESNVKEAVSRLQGGDKMTSRIWWDAKPGLPYLHPKQGTFPPEIY